MSQNIFCNPRLFINGVEVAYCVNATFIDNGGGQISSLKATISDPDFQNTHLFNSTVEFYLNYGSEDSVPLFRGIIKQYSAKEDGVTLSAFDPRTLLSGKEAFPIAIDDKKNYDGETIISFLLDVIDNIIDSTILSSEALNDMDKPIYMTGVRTEGSPYEIAIKLLEEKLDEDDVLSPLSYNIDILHGSNASSLVIKKERSLDNLPDISFSYNDGIKSVNYTDRASPSFSITSTEGIQVGDKLVSEQAIFKYGNSPQGKIGLAVDKKYGSRGEAIEKMIPMVLARQNTEKDIKLSVSKGFYLQKGNIVRIDVKDNNLRGQYRIEQRTIKYKQNSVTCNLTLNKKPIKVSDYISL